MWSEGGLGVQFLPPLHTFSQTHTLTCAHTHTHTGGWRKCLEAVHFVSFTPSHLPCRHWPWSVVHTQTRARTHIFTHMRAHTHTEVPIQKTCICFLYSGKRQRHAFTGTWVIRASLGRKSAGCREEKDKEQPDVIGSHVQHKERFMVNWCQLCDCVYYE